MFGKIIEFIASVATRQKLADTVFFNLSIRKQRKILNRAVHLANKEQLSVTREN